MFCKEIGQIWSNLPRPKVNVLQKSVDALQKGLREMDGEVVHLRSQNDMIKLQVNVNEDWESKSVSLLRMYMR